MDIRKIQEIDGIKDKKVLLRADLNVAFENGQVAESFKTLSIKETLFYLMEKGAKVAIISHLGRPDGKSDPELSLEKMKSEIERLLRIKVVFIPDCTGDKVKEGLRKAIGGEVLLLENLRFYPGEEKNDAEFAEKLSDNFDIFVNDAFGVCHRDQASVSGITKIIPAYSGFSLQKEIENLDKVKDNPKHPAVAIIGGAKIETKLPLIKHLEDIYDHILVGGKVANEALDQKIEFSSKVMLPIDFVGDRLDIGPETVKNFKTVISTAETIVWNGPMGKFEDQAYASGTAEILDSLVNSKAFVLIGGGESIQVLEEGSVMDKIGFVSTGGGAMLEYLSGKRLPGIEALRS